MGEPLESQTRGFLFADLRGYTRFADTHGDQAAAELISRYRILVRKVIARFSGAEIRTEGDSFYVVFSSASAAVNGGLAILEAAAAEGREPGIEALHVGVGVHAGEAAETPEGLVGSAINLAARLCALAAPGELLVSDTVRGLTRTFLPVRFVPRGQRRLKGIDEPVAVYAVLPSSSADPASTSRTGQRWQSRRSLAVAMTAVGLSLVLIVAVVVTGALPGAGTPGPAATPEAGASSGPGVSPSGLPGAGASPSSLLTVAEERLLERLPASVNDSCSPGSVADGSAGGSVSLHCRLALSAAADEVWIDEFPTSEALAGAFAEAIARTGAEAGDCASAPRAHGPWEVPSVHAGRLLCYQEGGAAWVVWTYDDDRILVSARRAGGDWEALHAWWRQTAIFLR